MKGTVVYLEDASSIQGCQATQIKPQRKKKSTVRDGSTYVVKILEMLENIFLNQFPYYL